MDELIAKISNVAGVGADQARRAISLVLNFVAKEAPQMNLPDLIAKIPGGSALLEEASEAAPEAEGLLGKIGGLLGGLGGEALALADRLKNEAGIELSKAEAVGAEIVSFLETKLGPDVSARIKSVLPGL